MILGVEMWSVSKWLYASPVEEMTGPQDEHKIRREGYEIVKAVRQIRKENVVSIRTSFQTLYEIVEFRTPAEALTCPTLTYLSGLLSSVCRTLCVKTSHLISSQALFACGAPKAEARYVCFEFELELRTIVWGRSCGDCGIAATVQHTCCYEIVSSRSTLLSVVISTEMLVV
jgi:hypothetical protein